jgi:two-component system, chemotaxis family, response regulator Rcp1
MMPSTRNEQPVQVLLIEDSSGDVRLTQEAFRDTDPAIQLHVASDGAEAMAFLSRTGGQPDAPRPDIILLDLNMPGMNGHDVLALIKADDRLKGIPTIILTSSQLPADIMTSYRLGATCFLNKSSELDAFVNLVKSITGFWLTRANLPLPAVA